VYDHEEDGHDDEEDEHDNDNDDDDVSIEQSRSIVVEELLPRSRLGGWRRRSNTTDDDVAAPKLNSLVFAGDTAPNDDGISAADNMSQTFASTLPPASSAAASVRKSRSEGHDATRMLYIIMFVCRYTHTIIFFNSILFKNKSQFSR